MQKRLNTKSWLAAAAVLTLSLSAGHALAECDENEEAQAGKAIAAVTAAKITPLVTGAGKQMLNMETCESGGGRITVEFKFNVIGADGLYWAQGSAKITGGAVDLNLSKLSPNLASASAAKGVKLASN